MSARILGLSAFFHDASAALAIDGRLVAAVDEERLSRDKHDPSLPTRAASSCLAAGGLASCDLDAVVFYEKPLRKFERLLVDHLAAFPFAFPRFSRALSSWLTKKLWVEQRIADALDVDAERVLFLQHHLAHAASAFFTSPFEDAAVLTVDGVGEWATSAIASSGVSRMSAASSFATRGRRSATMSPTSTARSRSGVRRCT